MQNRSVLRIVIILAAFWFMGCSSKPAAIRNIPYTFAEGTGTGGTAEIIFMNRVVLVDVEDESLPDPEQGTRWYPLQYPAGRSFNIRVYVVYHSDLPGYRRRGIFKCPPLEAGKRYKLWYEAAKKNYYSGAGRLIITYDNVTELKYSFGRPKYKSIYIQEIPPLSAAAE